MVDFGLSHYCGNPFCYASVCLIYNHSKRSGNLLDYPTLKLFNKDLSCFAFNLHNEVCDVFAYSFLFGAFVTAKCSWLEDEVKSVGGE